MMAFMSYGRFGCSGTPDSSATISEKSTITSPSGPMPVSDAVLQFLYRHVETPEFQCRFRWTENAVAFWDNRCAQHRAMWDYWPHTRSGTRVTVKGERPV